MPELICKILHIGKTTYYKYLKENYSIIKFLQTFSTAELEELEKTGRITRLEAALEVFEKVDNFLEIERFWKVPEVSNSEHVVYTGAEIYKNVLLPGFYRYVCEKRGVFDIDEENIKDMFFDYVNSTTFAEIDDSLKIYYLKLINDVDGFVFKMITIRFSVKSDKWIL